MSPLAATLEALLFLSSEPVSEADLAAAAECETDEIREAIAELEAAWAPGERGLVLRRLAGGWTLASAPETEAAARRLLARPRTAPLTPAQAETLAIVAYLQPVSRPEISRIRGVAADSAAGTLLERGIIEEAGRSPFGAILLRTTPLFLKLFGLDSLGDLPDHGHWDPTPEEAGELRDRLLRAGEARLGGPAAPPQPGFETDGESEDRESGTEEPGSDEAFAPGPDAETFSSEPDTLTSAPDPVAGPAA